MKRKRKLSVRFRLIALMLLCWMIPLLLITGFNVYYLNSDRQESRIFKAIDQLRFADQSVLTRLEQSVADSREASYDGTIIGLFETYEDGQITGHKLLARSSDYLSDYYSHRDNIDMAVLWYRESPNTMQVSTYNKSAGATYGDIKRYWEEDHGDVMRLAETLNTDAALYYKEGRLYLVRNLMTKSYDPAATLVLLLNQDHCFQSYSALAQTCSITLQLNDSTLQLTGQPVTREETGIDTLGSSAGYTLKNGRLHIYHTRSSENVDLTALVRFDDSTAYTLFYGYHVVIGAMLLLLIPLICLLLYVFAHHVSEPIQKLMYGASQIEEGNLGYQLEFEPTSSELEYLADSFNTMSRRLKYQFNHIYEEEVALRDARIKALQSHINPHFMNNTLEIINWEARLAGDEKVSKMIEALGTLMNAGIDRKMRPEIPLSEEMIYVNAYLHIISERLGSRLTIINEFPEDIMGCMVPRLILQPVIENAIEHGVVRKGQGTVILYGYREGDFLYLEILNESVLTKEDEAKIARLLDVNYDSSRESSENLGIANVNQRLRILYGEPCGLTVQQQDDQYVLSRLCIRAQKNSPDDDQKCANAPKMPR